MSPPELLVEPERPTVVCDERVVQIIPAQVPGFWAVLKDRVGTADRYWREPVVAWAVVEQSSGGRRVVPLIIGPGGMELAEPTTSAVTEFAFLESDWDPGGAVNSGHGD